MKPTLVSNTSDMVKVSEIDGKWYVVYGDGTTYMVDEWTAKWLVDMMQSLLKTRM